MAGTSTSADMFAGLTDADYGPAVGGRAADGQAADLVRTSEVTADADERTNRPTVKAGGRNPYDVAREVADYLTKRNHPPTLFRMGTAVVDLMGDGTLLPFDSDEWLTYICQQINFATADDKETGPTATVLKIVARIMFRGLPCLDGIAAAPYLDAAGRLVLADGYDEHTRLYLRADGLAVPDVPARPTADDVALAVKTICEDWLGDFPWAGEADRANAVAELLTVTGRQMFPLAPMFVHDASTPGSGKGLLLDLLSIVATGRTADVMVLPERGEEQQKTITSLLLAGRLIVAWDELHVIEGTNLAAVLTAEKYSGRLLGASKMIEVRNNLVYFALGNNVEVRGDMKRRVHPLRLVPADAHPERRKDFRHDNIKEWTLNHRGQLLAAAFTLWRNWIAGGRVPADVTMGSFDRWARTIGGVLAAAGITGFAGNRDEWLSYSEDDGDEWGGHLNALRLVFGERWFAIQDAADAIGAARVPRPPCKIDPDKDLRVSLGYGYRTIRDRWRGPVRLVRSTKRDSHDGAYTWRIETVQSMSSISSMSSSAGQSANHGSGDTGHTGDAPNRATGHAAISSGQNELCPVGEPALTCATGDTGHTGDDFASSERAGGRRRVLTTDGDGSWPVDVPADERGGWGPGTNGGAANP